MTSERIAVGTTALSSPTPALDTLPPADALDASVQSVLPTPEDFAGDACILCESRGQLVVCSGADAFRCRGCVCEACCDRFGWPWAEYTRAENAVAFTCPRCVSDGAAVASDGSIVCAADLATVASDPVTVLSGAVAARHLQRLAMARAFYRCCKRARIDTVDSFRRPADECGMFAAHPWVRGGLTVDDADGNHTACQVCSRAGGIMLLCDGCPAAFHMPTCLPPAVDIAAGHLRIQLPMTSVTADTASFPPPSHRDLWLCAVCRLHRHRLPPASDTHAPPPLGSLTDLFASGGRHAPWHWPCARFSGPRLVVLSLFDGIAAARLALQLLGVPARFIHYYASEIDRDALTVAADRFPDIRQLGRVESIGSRDDIPDAVDLLVGGSPCTTLSGLGKRAGLYCGPSTLFFEFVRVKRALRPRFYLFENVSSMRAVDKQCIRAFLTDDAAEPCYFAELDASRVTASLRRRIYIANYRLPAGDAAIVDRGIALQDVLDDPQCSVAESRKAFCITTNNSQGRPNDTRFNVISVPGRGARRGLSIHEAERCLGFPTDYTAALQSTATGSVFARRWRLVGNSFAAPMIAELLRPVVRASVVAAAITRDDEKGGGDAGGIVAPIRVTLQVQASTDTEHEHRCGLGGGSGARGQGDGWPARAER
ncbi:hypothetical protein CDCA_CDCA10G3080 [Cyanidium caldarium]|uniref:DNA (cytosine-5-)-methyltransferase n=1 Tax=Cyanidium caldarium TaxID=2771 RepID=A0AAV9IY87_CYACA|nr:hypothetical protein CDCA_CDCA10G3080 [Cyanidium caldarium]